MCASCRTLGSDAEPINWCWSPRSRPSSYQSASERLDIGTMLPCCFHALLSASSGCSIRSASAGAARLSPPFVSFTPSPHHVIVVCLVWIPSSVSRPTRAVLLFRTPSSSSLSSYELSSSLSALTLFSSWVLWPFVNPYPAVISAFFTLWEEVIR